jgi:hypothetical protein
MERDLVPEEIQEGVDYVQFSMTYTVDDYPDTQELYCLNTGWRYPSSLLAAAFPDMLLTASAQRKSRGIRVHSIITIPRRLAPIAGPEAAS